MTCSLVLQAWGCIPSQSLYLKTMEALSPHLLPPPQVSATFLTYTVLKFCISGIGIGTVPGTGVYTGLRSVLNQKFKLTKDYSDVFFLSGGFCRKNSFSYQLQV